MKSALRIASENVSFIKGSSTNSPVLIHCATSDNGYFRFATKILEHLERTHSCGKIQIRNCPPSNQKGWTKAVIRSWW
jgi:hypothetical protein